MFFPDGNTLASGSWDDTVRLWDIQTGQLQSTLTGHLAGVNTLALSRDGGTLASGSSDGTILLWAFTPIEPKIKADVNADGIVNIQDLVLVASHLGETGLSPGDVNGDGVVNIQDLVLIASHLGDS